MSDNHIYYICNLYLLNKVIRYRCNKKILTDVSRLAHAFIMCQLSNNNNRVYSTLSRTGEIAP